MQKKVLQKSDLIGAALLNIFVVLFFFCLAVLGCVASIIGLLSSLISGKGWDIELLIYGLIFGLAAFLLYRRIKEVIAIATGNFSIMLDYVKSKDVHEGDEGPDLYSLYFRGGGSYSVSRKRYGYTSNGAAFFVVRIPNSKRVQCCFEEEKYELGDDIKKYLKK